MVLEAKRVGWGASGRNGGQLIHGFVGRSKVSETYKKLYGSEPEALGWAGHKIIEGRLEKYNIDCEFRKGWLEVALTKRQFASIKANYAPVLETDDGRGWQLLSKAELQDTLSTEAYEGGVLSKSDGHLHPLKLCLGMRDACLSLGVRIYENSPVLDIAEGNKATVRTEGGSVTAGQVVLAANAYHSLYKRKFAGYAYSAGSYIMATEPLSEEVVREINPHRWAINDTRNVCDYYRMTEDGRVLFGGRVNYTGNKPKSIRDALMPRMLAVWPQLEGVAISHEWGGKIGVSMPRVPLVGKVADNISYAFAYTGHGVNTGNLLGVVLADAITGNTKLFGAFAAAPKWRLPLGQCLGKQAVAAAIGCYSIVDRF